MAPRRIQEYDPVSYVTAIGDVIISLRLYWISSRGDPFGLPRCDIRLQQGELRQEQTGLDVKDWFFGFPEDLMEHYSHLLTTLVDFVHWDEQPGVFRRLELDYVGNLLSPLAIRVCTTDEHVAKYEHISDCPMLGVSLSQCEENSWFWIQLRYDSLEKLQRIRLDLHSHIEWMKC